MGYAAGQRLAPAPNPHGASRHFSVSMKSSIRSRMTGLPLICRWPADHLDTVAGQTNDALDEIDRLIVRFDRKTTTSPRLGSEAKMRPENKRRRERKRITAITIGNLETNNKSPTSNVAIIDRKEYETAGTGRRGQGPRDNDGQPEPQRRQDGAFLRLGLSFPIHRPNMATSFRCQTNVPAASDGALLNKIGQSVPAIVFRPTVQLRIRHGTGERTRTLVI